MGCKLVRDKLARALEERGARIVRAPPSAAVRLLAEKVVEEAVELREDPSVEEMADVLEALVSLARAMGVPWSRVVGEMERKRRERGGFEGLHLLCYDNS